jgi:hypothetical protein
MLFVPFYSKQLKQRKVVSHQKAALQEGASVKKVVKVKSRWRKRMLTALVIVVGCLIGKVHVVVVELMIFVHEKLFLFEVGSPLDDSDADETYDVINDEDSHSADSECMYYSNINCQTSTTERE